MNLIPGKFYLPSLKLIRNNEPKSKRAGINLYIKVSQDPQIPLHHYYLFAITEKPPILFIEQDILAKLSIGILGPRFYHNYPDPEKLEVVSAGKFLHEDRFVWVIDETLKILKMVNK